MNKHQKAIDLIEADIAGKVKEVDYYSRIKPNWPHLGKSIEEIEQEIAQLQHTREVLVLIGGTNA